MRRPRLKSWRVAAYCSEIAIMQPIQDLLLLGDAGITRAILAIRPVPCRSLRPILIGLAVIRFLPAAANEQHITDPDVSALRCWPDVNPLILSALVQLFP